MSKHIFRYLVYASFALVFSGCVKETEPLRPGTDVPEGCEELVLTALSEDSRTTVNGSGNTLWAAGDQIKVICSDGTASNFELLDGAGTATGDFRGFIPSGKTALYAVYPAARYTSVSGTTVKVSIPSSREGDFGSGNIAVAKVDASSHNMTFKNVNSFISFTLPSGTDVTSVVVESVSGSSLGGTLSVNCSGSVPAASTVASGVSSITTTTSSGAGTYFISIAPGITHAKGFKLSYKKGSAVTGVCYLNRNITTTVNANYQMGTVDTKGNYYVTVSGAGSHSGMNWANAISGAEMWKKLTLTSAQSADAATKAAKIAAIDGATFHLGAGTYNFGANPTIVFNESSAVALNFKGGYPAAGGSQNLNTQANRAIFTGADSHQALILDGKLNVAMEGINIENGLVATDETGTLHVNASTVSLGMSYCDVKNNNNMLGYDNEGDKYHYWGAGIWTRSSSFSADHVTFSGNKAYGGAALEIFNGGATVSNCTFSNNDVYMQGGAVILANDASGTFSNCTFSGNNGRKGGALYLQGNAGVDCTSCTFSGNTASLASGGEQGGGAVFLTSSAGSSATKSFTSCSFSENSSASGAGAFYGDGYVNYTLTTCTFTGNSATEGGAIRTTGTTTANIRGCTFGGSASGAPNHSSGTGGAIYALSAASVVIAKSGSTATRFEGNYAETAKGGAIRHNTPGAFSCTGALFKGNHSDATSGDHYGGAVAIDHKNSSVTLTDCTFDSNYTNRYGGSALSYQAGTDASGGLTVNTTTFKDNYNNYDGSDASDNSDGYYAKFGGAVRLGNDGTKCRFNGCTFTGNHTAALSREVKSAWGGAITYYGDDMLYLDGCYFEGNYAAGGGAISAFQCGGGIYMNGCSFKGNYVTYRQGTTIRFEQSVQFCMNNCSIYDDTYAASPSSDNCTWVYLNGGGSARRIEKCVFSNCSMIARSTSHIASQGTDQQIVYVLNTKDGTTGAFLNNIILNDGSASNKNGFWLNLAPMVGYNNVYRRKGCNGNTSYTGTGDKTDKTVSDFASLSWSITNNTWEWAAWDYSPKMTKSNFASSLGSYCSDFKTWLTDIGALNKDTTGADRGSGDWVVGARNNP